MVSNDIYKELSRIKNKKSFTETIKYLIEKKENKKTGKDLNKCLGSLKKEDMEFESASKELRGLYKKWSKKYA